MVSTAIRTLLLGIALALPLLAAACQDSMVDSDTATVTPRTVRDSLRLRDSTIYDTVEVPVLRATLRKGRIYFKSGPNADIKDSLEMVIDPLSYTNVTFQAGAPSVVELRVMARVAEPPAHLAPRGVPSWFYLYAGRIELGANGKGEKTLQGDPRKDETGIALSVRPPWGDDLLVSIGPGHGRVMVDTVNTADRVVHANVKAAFNGQKNLVIDSMTLTIGY